MKILGVDTCFGACSVAILDNGRTLAHRFASMDRGHAEVLAPMVDEAMQEAGIPYAALDRLAVTVGPGTFTGQRIGLAFMRGLRVALKKPLAGITSLETMAQQASAEANIPLAVALHDARRDEVYLEIVKNGVSVFPPAVLLFDDAMKTVAGYAGRARIVLCGTAAPRAGDVLANAELSPVRQPDALWTARLAASRETSDQPPRPLYLRAPDAKLPGGKTL
ncbi:MAG TPA: tRNA (adenosine(37)-N6)-threonylcarbamoyltransferase complex dimerization subunit type 1 TsaB [Rhizomicrobium sp.]